MGFWQNSTHSIHSKVWTFKLRAAPRWSLRDHQQQTMTLVYKTCNTSETNPLWYQSCPYNHVAEHLGYLATLGHHVPLDQIWIFECNLMFGRWVPLIVGKI